MYQNECHDWSVVFEGDNEEGIKKEQTLHDEETTRKKRRMPLCVKHIYFYKDTQDLKAWNVGREYLDKDHWRERQPHGSQIVGSTAHV